MSKYVKALDRRLVFELTKAIELGNFHDNYVMQNVNVSSRGREDVMTIIVGSSLKGATSNSTFSYMFDDHGLVNTGEGTQPVNSVFSEYDHYLLMKTSKDVTKKYMTFLSSAFGRDYVIDELKFRCNELESATNALETKTKEFLKANETIAQIEQTIKSYPYDVKVPDSLTLEYAHALMNRDKSKSAIQKAMGEQKYASEMHDFIQQIALSFFPSTIKKQKATSADESSS